MQTTRVIAHARSVTFADRELEKARLRSELKSADVAFEKVRLSSELKSLNVALEKLRLRSETKSVDDELKKVDTEMKRKELVSLAKTHARNLAKKYGKSLTILGCMSYLFDETECVPNDATIITWYNHCAKRV